MKPKKKLIEKAVANGSIDRMNGLLSASHILHCVANNLVEEASDLMMDNGLMLGMLKKRHNDLLKAADSYFNEFAGMVVVADKKMEMFSDMELIEEKIRAWAKVEAGWKPKNVE